MGAFAFGARLTRFVSSAIQGTHLPRAWGRESRLRLCKVTQVSAEIFLLERNARLHHSQHTSTAPLLRGVKLQFRGVTTPGGRLLVPKPGTERTSPKSWAHLCLARGRLRAGNLQSGHGRMPGIAGGEMLPDLTLTHQYWPEAPGTLGRAAMPQRDSLGKDSLPLPGGMTRAAPEGTGRREVLLGSQGGGWDGG